MKYLLASMWFWAAVLLTAYGIGQLNEAMHADAATQRPLTFNERAGHMFDQTAKSDSLMYQQQDLKGGVLLDNAKRTLIFPFHANPPPGK